MENIIYYIFSNKTVKVNDIDSKLLEIFKQCDYITSFFMESIFIPFTYEDVYNTLIYKKTIHPIISWKIVCFLLCPQHLVKKIAESWYDNIMYFVKINPPIVDDRIIDVVSDSSFIKDKHVSIYI